MPAHVGAQQFLGPASGRGIRCRPAAVRCCPRRRSRPRTPRAAACAVPAGATHLDVVAGRRVQVLQLRGRAAGSGARARRPSSSSRRLDAGLRHLPLARGSGVAAGSGRAGGRRSGPSRSFGGVPSCSSRPRWSRISMVRACSVDARDSVVGSASRSSTSTSAPPSRSSPASISPTGPAPTTMTCGRPGRVRGSWSAPLSAYVLGVAQRGEAVGAQRGPHEARAPAPRRRPAPSTAVMFSVVDDDGVLGGRPARRRQSPGGASGRCAASSARAA